MKIIFKERVFFAYYQYNIGISQLRKAVSTVKIRQKMGRCMKVNIFILASTSP